MRERLMKAGKSIVNDFCGRCRSLKTMAEKGAKPAAYLNLLADIMHNFTGLSPARSAQEGTLLSFLCPSWWGHMSFGAAPSWSS